MSDQPIATAYIRAALRDRPADAQVILGYEARFLRRRRLRTEGGLSFLVDLAETVSLDAGDCFVLSDNRLVEVLPADEEVLEITGDLPRLAWHIGNRHTPCQIEPKRLLIRRDHVLEAMLTRLGAQVTPTIAPFTPEGGAYGHGRTMGHDHGPADAPHSHDDAATFGHFHDHGDGHVHFHPAPAVKAALPFGHLRAKG